MIAIPFKFYDRERGWLERTPGPCYAITYPWERREHIHLLNLQNTGGFDGATFVE